MHINHHYLIYRSPALDEMRRRIDMCAPLTGLMRIARRKSRFPSFHDLCRTNKLFDAFHPEIPASVESPVRIYGLNRPILLATKIFWNVHLGLLPHLGTRRQQLRISCNKNRQLNFRVVCRQLNQVLSTVSQFSVSTPRDPLPTELF